MKVCYCNVARTLVEIPLTDNFLEHGTIISPKTLNIIINQFMERDELRTTCLELLWTLSAREKYKSMKILLI